MDYDHFTLDEKAEQMKLIVNAAQEALEKSWEHIAYLEEKIKHLEGENENG